MDNIRKFDRHASMDAKTREAILGLIRGLLVTNTRGSVENMLYGFFDGYDYSSVIPEHKEMEIIKEENFDLYLKILGVCQIVSKYPDGTTRV